MQRQAHHPIGQQKPIDLRSISAPIPQIFKFFRKMCSIPGAFPNREIRLIVNKTPPKRPQNPAFWPNLPPLFATFRPKSPQT
jgi:hypothetical protein